MSLVRRAAIGYLSFLLFVSLSGFGLAFTANRTVFNPDFVVSRLDRLEVSPLVGEMLKEQVPEEVMAKLKRNDREKYKFISTFDYLPGRKFEVKVEEFATDSDPKTQTYLVKFVMPAPKDVSILPGMTATVAMYPKNRPTTQKTQFLIPVDAVGIDENGQYYVWTVEKKKGAHDNIGIVHRVRLKVGEMDKDKMLVTAGLHSGDRIAAAGINFLKEGEEVRIIDSDAGIGRN